MRKTERNAHVSQRTPPRSELRLYTLLDAPHRGLASALRPMPPPHLHFAALTTGGPLSPESGREQTGRLGCNTENNTRRAGQIEGKASKNACADVPSCA